MVERDYAELIALDPAKAPKSVLIIAGAVLEGLLLDALLVSGRRGYEDFETASTRSLHEMIAPTKTEGIIREDRLTDLIRYYRALAHPAREVREDVAFTSRDAIFARSAVDVVIQEVQQWHDKRNGSYLGKRKTGKTGTA